MPYEPITTGPASPSNYKPITAGAAAPSAYKYTPITAPAPQAEPSDVPYDFLGLDHSLASAANSSTTPRVLGAFHLLPDRPTADIPATISKLDPKNTKGEQMSIPDIISGQGTYTTLKLAHDNPEKIDPLQYLARGIGFGHDPANDLTNWSAGFAKTPTLSDLPEPVTQAQKWAQGIGNMLTISLASPAVDSVIAEGVARIPGGAELLSKLATASVESPWKSGYPLAVGKAFANGSLFGLLTKNKQSIAQNALQSGGTFAAFEALAFPVLSFFKPMLSSVGKTTLERSGLANVDPSQAAGEPISDTLWFRNPKDDSQLLKVTRTGVELAPKDALIKEDQATFSPRILNKVDIEAFKENPSLYDRLAAWLDGTYKKHMATPGRQGGYIDLGDFFGEKPASPSPSVPPEAAPVAPAESPVAASSEIAPEMQPLAEEAKKYKSAEEFVNSKTKAYHGGSIDDLENFDPEFKIGESRNDPLSNMGINLGDRNTAQFFADQKGGQVVEAYLDPKKIKKTTYNSLLHEVADAMQEQSGVDFGSQIRRLKTTAEKNEFLIDNMSDPEIARSISEKYRSEGFDLIEYKNTLDGGKAYIPLTKDAIKTKTQLTDFYKKAVGETAPIAEPAPAANPKELQKQSTQLNSHFRKYNRTMESLDAALRNPEGHAKAYGAGKVEEYKATLADLKAKIQAIDPHAEPASIPSPIEEADTSDGSVEPSRGVEGIAPAEEGSGPKDVAMAKRLTNRLEVLLTEREMHQEALKHNPARELAKYADRNGSLPEVIGGTSSTFGNRGDDIVTELGFPDSESARDAYENYKIQKKRAAEFDGKIAEVRKKLAEANSVDRDVNSLERFLNSSANKDEKARSEMEKKMLAEPETATQLAERQRIAKERMVEIIGRMYKQTSPAERETPQFILQLTEEAYNITHDEFQKISADDPTRLIHIDTNTPSNKRVHILDYLRTPERVLQKIGLGGVAKKLRHGSEAAMLELPAHIDLIRHWGEDMAKISPNSNRQIFKYLDGQKTIKQNYNGKWVPLLPEEMKIAKDIRAYLRSWADRLGLPADSKISHYITHIFGLGEMEKEFDEDMAKIIADKIPGSVYDPFLQKRLGRKGYIEDTIKSLEAYAKRAVRKASMDPALKELKEAASDLELSQEKFVKRYADLVNMRPTELDNLVDTLIKNVPGIGYKFGPRPVATISRFLRQTMYRSSLGLNFHSALKNLTQGVNTFSKLGPKYTAIGYSRLMTQAGSSELKDSGVLKQDFVQDKTLSATRKGLEKFDKVLFFFQEVTEKINRGSAYFGAKQKALDEGKTEDQAKEYAKKMVRDTQFSYGSIDTPVALNNDIVKLFTQFMTFPIKQTEFIAEMVQKKEWGGLLRYIIASAVLVYTVGQAFDLKGRDFIPASAFIPKQGFGGESRFGSAASLSLPLAVGAAIYALPGSIDPTKGVRGGKSGLEKTIQDIGSKIPIPASVQVNNLWKWFTADETKTPGSGKSSGGLPKLPKLPSMNGALPKLPKLPKI